MRQEGVGFAVSDGRILNNRDVLLRAVSTSPDHNLELS